MELIVIVEKNKDEFWGRIEGFDFFTVSCSKSEIELVENLKLIILDYIQHEGCNDVQWKGFDVDTAKFYIKRG